MSLFGAVKRSKRVAIGGATRGYYLDEVDMERR